MFYLYSLNNVRSLENMFNRHKETQGSIVKRYYWATDQEHNSTNNS